MLLLISINSEAIRDQLGMRISTETNIDEYVNDKQVYRLWQIPFLFNQLLGSVKSNLKTPFIPSWSKKHGRLFWEIPIV